MVEGVLMSLTAIAGFILVWPLERLPITLRVVLAFPVGLAAWLLIGLTLLLLPVSYDVPTSLALVIVVAMLVGAAAYSRRRPVVATLGLALPIGVAVFLLSLGFQALEATILTPDSVRYLLFSGAMVETGNLDLVPRADLLTRGPIVPLMHAPAGLSATQHLASVTPLLAATGYGAFLLLAWTALGTFATPARWRVILLLSAIVAIVGSNRGVYHAFYVNGHLLFAISLLLVVIGYWMTVSTGSIEWLLPALPGLAVTVVLRPEAPLVVAPFLMAALIHRRAGTPGRWLTAIAFSTPIVAWFGFYLIPQRAVPLQLDEPEVGLVLLAVAMLAFTALTEWLPRSLLVRYAPALVVLVPLGVLLVAVARDPTIGEATAIAIGSNLLFYGAWGVVWPVLLVVLCFALSIVRLPNGRVFTTPLAAFSLIFFILPYLRGSPFRTGSGDSGNRMLMHVFLVVLIYLVLAGGWGAAQASRRIVDAPHS